MSETFRQACKEFQGGLFSYQDGKTYPVDQIIAFLDAGGTEEQIKAGALDKDAKDWEKQHVAQLMANLIYPPETR